MNFMQLAVGQVISLIVFGLLVAGVLKAFQMAADLGEIKDLLRDIKRNTQDVSAERASESSPNLMQAYSDAEFEETLSPPPQI